MDLAFFRRAQQGFADRTAARLDYRVLVATLEAIQSSSATARAARAAGSPSEPEPAHDPVVEVLLGGSAWQEAVAAQGGCFNPQAARRRRNGA